jgi:hypothetical protein
MLDKPSLLRDKRAITNEEFGGEGETPSLMALTIRKDQSNVSS